MLAPFKYAGYPMLLQAVALPPDESQESSGSHFLAEERTPRLQVSFSSKLRYHLQMLALLFSVAYSQKKAFL